jgi:pimeloyl-ACP methyl ester carboxylesterase
MPKLKTQSLEMYYEVHGKGPPLVLIPGFSADHSVWDNILDLLSSHYKIVVFDLRGSGQTEVPAGPYTIDQLADDVYNLCQNLSIPKAKFLGNSMGGYIVQSLAYRYPNHVEAAIIENSTMKLSLHFELYLEGRLEAMKRDTPKIALIKEMMGWAYSNQFLSKPGKIDELIQLTVNNPYPFTLKGYEGQFAALKDFDSTAWCQKIQAPTLVIGSDQDLIFYESDMQSLARHIPHAQYYGFKNSGHIPHHEYPEKFVEVVNDFYTSRAFRRVSA